MQAHAGASLPDEGASGSDGALHATAAGETDDAARGRGDAARILAIVGSTDSAVILTEAAPAPGSGARYRLPIDDRLRAAVRGESGIAGQREVDMAPGLRPREIQSRIRAGASVEQVAAAAGCSATRIEGFAYPVLLERATIADRARAVQPLPDNESTLGEIATEALASRGQDEGAVWDAFKDERGWTVSLTWQAGHSEIRAEWAFTPRATGGTVAPRNADAAALVEPGHAPLRPVDQRAAERGFAAVGDAAHPDHESAAPRDPMHRDAAADAAAVTASRTTVSRTAESRAAAPQPAAQPAPAGDVPSDQQHGADDDAHAARKSPRRGHKPQMPSWEDVLLGTRTAEH